MSRLPPILLVVAGASAFAATPAPIDRAVQRIDAAAKTTQTLAADFAQKNRMKLFKQELTSKGRLVFRAPRQIRWEYTSPDPSVLVLDGATATMRAPGAAPQVFDLARDPTLRAVFDQLLTFVGGGAIADVQAGYEITLLGEPERPTLVLAPRAGTPAAKTFARIDLVFDDQALVRAIRLVEQNGDEKEIVFSHQKRNAAVPADAFK